MPRSFLATVKVFWAKKSWSIRSSFTYDSQRKLFLFFINIASRPANIKTNSQCLIDAREKYLTLMNQFPKLKYSFTENALLIPTLGTLNAYQ